MANSLFNEFGNKQMNPMNQLLSEARELRKTIQNPRAEVERLLQTGQMSQSQFNFLAQEASRIIGGGAFNK